MENGGVTFPVVAPYAHSADAHADAPQRLPP